MNAKTGNMAGRMLLGAALGLLAAGASAAEWFIVPPEPQASDTSISLVLYPRSTDARMFERLAAQEDQRWLFLPELLRGNRDDASSPPASSMPQGLRLGFVVSHDQLDGTPGSPVLVADCSDGPLLRALGLSSTCAALAANAPGSEHQRWSQGEVGAGWSLGSSEISFVAGAGYRSSSARDSWTSMISAEPGPWIGGCQALHGRENSQWLGLSSRFDVSADTNWSVGLNLERSEMSAFSPFNQFQELTTASIGIGVVYGQLSGGVATRVRALEGFNQPDPMYFGTMDLGFSWRTPWSARISFGAQNIFSTTPSSSNPGASSDPMLDSARARTPYVRYHQDL